MDKFLYGAAVQGIQSFIFQTNSLKEIIGASELVENICTSLFAEMLGKSYDKLKDDPNAIINAAGNIKYVFESEEQCRMVFREFPKEVLTLAPGITISQAVVKFNDCDADKDSVSKSDNNAQGKSLSEQIKALEDKLRSKRNIPLKPLTSGLMGMQRSRETGLPERWHNKEQYHRKDNAKVSIGDTDDMRFRDESTYRKLCAIDKGALWTKATGLSIEKENLRFLRGKQTDNVSYFTGDNDWIAVIHADGNGLGAIVRELGSKGDRNAFHKFSTILDQSTCEAARQAFNQAYRDDSRFIPFRPIVLGGDDLTVIIRGDLAIEFTKCYLDAFEKNTKENFRELAKDYDILSDGLTACAGIAFIKSSFPYYYGYNLAEELCGEAKSMSGRKYSCLMFHKVQDSFVASYEDIVRRELTTPSGDSFKFGPYYLDETVGNNLWSIEKLLKTVHKLDGDNGNAIKSSIRQWLSAMMERNGSAKANQMLNRLKRLWNSNTERDLIKDLSDGVNHGDRPNTQTDDNTRIVQCYPAYDVLSLHTIYFQKTKI